MTQFHGITTFLIHAQEFLEILRYTPQATALSPL